MNKQSPMSQQLDKKGRLYIQKIFASIQGEGPFVGQPAIFIRLKGCNLNCLHCDTDYTSSTLPLLAPSQFLPRIRVMAKDHHTKLVVITGGEPFRQNIEPLISALFDMGMLTQIETNGTLYISGIDKYCTTYKTNVVIVCSPKRAFIDDRLKPLISYWKYVTDPNISTVDGLPRAVLGGLQRPCRPPSEILENNPERVFVQPEDDGIVNTAANKKIALDVCRRYGYRLSLQLHKLIGVE